LVDTNEFFDHQVHNHHCWKYGILYNPSGSGAVQNEETLLRFDGSGYLKVEPNGRNESVPLPSHLTHPAFFESRLVAQLNPPVAPNDLHVYNINNNGGSGDLSTTLHRTILQSDLKTDLNIPYASYIHACFVDNNTIIAQYLSNESPPQSVVAVHDIGPSKPTVSFQYLTENSDGSYAERATPIMSKNHQWISWQEWPAGPESIHRTATIRIVKP